MLGVLQVLLIFLVVADSFLFFSFYLRLFLCFLLLALSCCFGTLCGLFFTLRLCFGR